VVAASALLGFATKRREGLCVVGHSGLEPEANRSRIRRRVCPKEARDGGADAWSWSRRGHGRRGGHHGDWARMGR
jgi:hypothetical protein